MPNITRTQGSAIRGRRRSRASRSGLTARAGLDDGNGVAESELDTSAFLRFDERRTRWHRRVVGALRRSERRPGQGRCTAWRNRAGRTCHCSATSGGSPGRDRPVVSRHTSLPTRLNHGRSSCARTGRGRVTEVDRCEWVLISVVNRNADTPLPLSQSATSILRHQGLESQRHHEGLRHRKGLP